MLEAILLESMAREFGGEVRPVTPDQSGPVVAHKHFSEIQFDRVSINTRTLNAGDLFVALKGERFDAHNFLEEAVSKGAAGLVIEAQQQDKLPPLFRGPIWLVENATLALGNIGRWQRRHFHNPVVAITGSSGKTTVKEMLRNIFSADAGKDAVFATSGNFNNHIGVPLSLFELNHQHQYAAIEMGASGPGEIAYLADLVKPDVAMVNNVMAAHVEGFGSVAAVARAKGEIYEGLGKDGVAVINAADEFSEQWLRQNRHRNLLTFFSGTNEGADTHGHYNLRTGNATMQANGCYSFCLTCEKEGFPAQSVTVNLAVLGRHNIANAAAAATCAFALGINIESIRAGLECFDGEPGRLQICSGTSGFTLIDDTYNANPGSVRAAIDVLAEIPGETLLVLGDMAELGEESPRAHSDIGVSAANRNITRLLTLGSKSVAVAKSFCEKTNSNRAVYFLDMDELIEHLQILIGKETGGSDMSGTDGRELVILVKGSRSAGMERVVHALQSSVPRFRVIQPDVLQSKEVC